MSESSSFLMMTRALDATYAALERRNDSEGSLSVECGHAQPSATQTLVPTAASASLGPHFACPQCRDKRGYYHSADGYRDWDDCPYCRPMPHDPPLDAARDILADDRDFEI